MEGLRKLSRLIRKWNDIESEIASLIGCPGLVQNIGEYVAEKVFNLKLEKSKTTKGFDGRFTLGGLRGRTVNVKIYPEREGFIDWKDDALPDYFLILAGPKRKGRRTTGKGHPLIITNTYLFDTRKLRRLLVSRNVQIKRATNRTVQASVRVSDWEEAEVFPKRRCMLMNLSPKQKKMLALFG